MSKNNNHHNQEDRRRDQHRGQRRQKARLRLDVSCDFADRDGSGAPRQADGLVIIRPRPEAPEESFTGLLDGVMSELGPWLASFRQEMALIVSEGPPVVALMRALLLVKQHKVRWVAVPEASCLADDPELCADFAEKLASRGVALVVGGQLMAGDHGLMRTLFADLIHARA